jgi:hypothetical protein
MELNLSINTSILKTSTKHCIVLKKKLLAIDALSMLLTGPRKMGSINDLMIYD